MEARNATQNARGEWVPAIPFPLYGIRKKCLRCGRKFWTTNRYREHYALHHILDPAPEDDPA
jgi:hypothetical protein